MEEIVLANNGILALPANIFRSNTNLKVINLGGNRLTMSDFTESKHNVTGGLLSHLTKLTHFDISDNGIVGDTASPLPTNLFAKNLNIEQIFLTNNNITFLSAHQFQNNRLLNRLGMGGIFNTFRTSSTCALGYYVTRIFLPSIEIGQAVYYACDSCEPEEGSELSLSGDSYTCWTDPSNWETHHPPARCPRGSYCDVTTKTQLFCPKGKYNPIAGQDAVASCKNCLDGYYNPMEGQQTCAFQCPPGTYGKHSDVTLGDPATVADSISKCKDCPLGTFCAGQGTVDPVDCPMGKYGEISTSGAQREADRCTNCPEHTYSDTVGAVSAMSCKSCDAGKFSVRGSSRQQDCTNVAAAPCPSGEGRKTLNGACAPCPRGQFSASGNPCRLCPNGFYGPNEKAEACVACPSDTAGTSRTASGASLCGFVPGSFGSGARVHSRPSWVSANVSLMRASMVPDIQEIPTVNGLQYSQSSASHQGMIDSLKMSLYPILGCLSLMVLLLHRHCSTKWCRIDLFAAAHMIQDTHALRKVKSRLGGAFTWVLLFAIVAILVQSITGRGFQTIMSDTAERVNQFEYLQAQAEGSGETGFGTLELHIDIFALMQDEQDMVDKCNAVYLDRPKVADRQMRCTVKHKSIGATDCAVTVTCETTFELIGDAVLPMKLPIEFQTLAWQVGAKTWEYFDPGAITLSEPWTRFNTTVRATLAPLHEGEILSGTRADPTLTVFGVTRGFADGSQVARKATSSGLQLGYKQTVLKFDLVEDYVPQLYHVVDFKFEVLPALHVETTTETLSTIQLAATIFSLIASATKVLKLIKRCLAKGIDEHLKKRVPPPEDVKRRTELLHEDNLMHRRFQKLMSQHSFLKGSGKVPRKHGRDGEAFVALEDEDVEEDSMVELGVEMIPVTVSTDVEKEGEEGTEGVQEESSSTATNATRKPVDNNHTQIPSLGNSIAKSADESSNDNDRSSQAEAENVVLRSRVDELEKQNDGLLARLADLENIMSSVTAGAWHARREEALKESKTSVVGKAIDGVGDLLEGGSIY